MVVIAYNFEAWSGLRPSTVTVSESITFLKSRSNIESHDTVTQGRTRYCQFHKFRHPIIEIN